jgi:hypothetical protein
MTLQEILEKLEDPATSPGQLSAILMHLSADYTRKSQDFGALLSKKAKAWPRLREKHASDKQADKAWDATLGGAWK